MVIQYKIFKNKKPIRIDDKTTLGNLVNDLKIAADIYNTVGILPNNYKGSTHPTPSEGIRIESKETQDGDLEFKLSSLYNSGDEISAESTINIIYKQNGAKISGSEEHVTKDTLVLEYLGRLSQLLLLRVSDGEPLSFRHRNDPIRQKLVEQIANNMFVDQITNENIADQIKVYARKASIRYITDKEFTEISKLVGLYEKQANEARERIETHLAEQNEIQRLRERKRISEKPRQKLRQMEISDEETSDDKELLFN